MPVLCITACRPPTTSLQPKPDAEPKKADSALSYRSRSSRAGVSSSTNLKNKNRFDTALTAQKKAYPALEQV
jgi:hypothetical protein